MPFSEASLGCKKKSLPSAPSPVAGLYFDLKQPPKKIVGDHFKVIWINVSTAVSKLLCPGMRSGCISFACRIKMDHAVSRSNKKPTEGGGGSVPAPWAVDTRPPPSEGDLSRTWEVAPEGPGEVFDGPLVPLGMGRGGAEADAAGEAEEVGRRDGGPRAEEVEEPRHFLRSGTGRRKTVEQAPRLYGGSTPTATTHTDQVVQGKAKERKLCSYRTEPEAVGGNFKTLKNNPGFF